MIYNSESLPMKNKQYVSPSYLIPLLVLREVARPTVLSLFRVLSCRLTKKK